MLMDIGRQIRKQDLKENVTKKKGPISGIRPDRVYRYKSKTHTIVNFFLDYRQCCGAGPFFPGSDSGSGSFKKEAFNHENFYNIPASLLEKIPLFLFFKQPLINVGMIRKNIIQNFFCFILYGAGAGPSQQIRLRPKSPSSDQLRNTDYQSCI